MEDVLFAVEGLVTESRLIRHGADSQARAPNGLNHH
jgi:hypothetical protein